MWLCGHHRSLVRYCCSIKVSEQRQCVDNLPYCEYRRSPPYTTDNSVPDQWIFSLPNFAMCTGAFTSTASPVSSLTSLQPVVSYCLSFLWNIIRFYLDTPLSLFRLQNILDYYTPRFLGARVSSTAICDLDLSSFSSCSACSMQNSPLTSPSK